MHNTMKHMESSDGLQRANSDLRYSEQSLFLSNASLSRSALSEKNQQTHQQIFKNDQDLYPSESHKTKRLHKNQMFQRQPSGSCVSTTRSPSIEKSNRLLISQLPMELQKTKEDYQRLTNRGLQIIQEKKQNKYSLQTLRKSSSSCLINTPDKSKSQDSTATSNLLSSLKKELEAKNKDENWQFKKQSSITHHTVTEDAALKSPDLREQLAPRNKTTSAFRKHTLGIKSVTFENGLTYEGGWKDDLPHGHGRMTHVSGLIFDGFWCLGKPNGSGSLTFPNGHIIEGFWDEAQLSGFGRHEFPSHVVLNGMFECNVNTGFGTITFPQDSILIDTIHGSWQNNTLHGPAEIHMKYPKAQLLPVDFVAGVAKVSSSSCPYCSEEDQQSTNQEDFCYWCFDPNQGILCHQEQFNLLNQTSDQPSIESYFSQWKSLLNSLKPSIAKSNGSEHSSKRQQENLAALTATSYSGDLINGRRSGQGTLTFSSGITYSGKWLADKPHGYGTYSNTASKISYVGEWKNGLLNGYGTLTFADGSIFKGQFMDNLAQGHGTLHYSTGETYTGQWKYDKGHGYGTYTMMNNTIYQGQWNVGHATSRQGTLYNSELQIKYTGGFKQGKFYGYGQCCFPDNTEYRGYWHNNKFFGDIQPTTLNSTQPTILKSQFAELIQNQNSSFSLVTCQPFSVSEIQHLFTDADYLEECDESLLQEVATKHSLLSDIILTELSHRYCWKPVITPLPEFYTMSKETNQFDLNFMKLNDQQTPTTTYDNTECMLHPLPLRQTSVTHYEIPKVQATYAEKPYSVCVPRLIEVPIPEDLFDPKSLELCAKLSQKFDALCDAPEAKVSYQHGVVLHDQRGAYSFVHSKHAQQDQINQLVNNFYSKQTSINYNRLKKILELASKLCNRS